MILPTCCWFDPSHSSLAGPLASGLPRKGELNSGEPLCGPAVSVGQHCLGGDLG